MKSLEILKDSYIFQHAAVANTVFTEKTALRSLNLALRQVIQSEAL